MSSLPNLLTIARIAIIPLFVAAFYFSGEESRWLAFSLFCFAAITDAFDGLIARRWQAEAIPIRCSPAAGGLATASTIERKSNSCRSTR